MIPIPNISIAVAAKLGALLFGLLALTFLLHDRNHWKAAAELRQQQLAASKAAFDQTISSYRAAAIQARAADAANAARVKSEQTAISERTANEFEARIAAARADARRLRDNQGAAANSGRGGTTPVPGLPAAAAGTAQTTGQDGLSDSDKLIATEQAIQLDELIRWVNAQHLVDNNGPAASTESAGNH